MPIDLPPDYDEFKAEVIADQAGDDQGVYEVWWSANSRYPALSLSLRLAVAEAAVQDLLRDGRFVLVRGEWIGTDQVREFVSDPEATLLDWATWVPQQDAPVIWITEA